MTDRARTILVLSQRPRVGRATLRRAGAIALARAVKYFSKSHRHE